MKNEQMTQRIAELEMICSEAYQVVGVLGSDAGRFGSGDLTKILDNLSAHARIHTDVLPFMPGKQIEALEAEITALKNQLSRGTGHKEFVVLEDTASEDWKALAQSAMEGRSHISSINASSKADQEAWVDQNVSGSPALIQAMKNHAQPDHESVRSAFVAAPGTTTSQMQDAFNAAINFAIAQSAEAAQFLTAWREGDTCEWPEFSQSPSTPQPN